ncbi:MAG: formylglycine-generating enzyme family protein, partial [Pseudomonadota bacterium]
MSDRGMIPSAPKTGCCPQTMRPPAGAARPWDQASRALCRATTVPVPAGHAMVGTDQPELPADGEGPARRVKLRGFAMDATCVTVARFSEFVAATGYTTEAERFGWSFVFWSQIPADIPASQALPEAPWWRRIDGATWQAPFGPGTHAQPDDPVTQVSWSDAAAYATWAGGRLPTEAEWEHAARGGQGAVRFPWGDAEPGDNGPYHCNIWQGRFPELDTGADGHAGVAPAQSYAPNPFGLYNMCGNVWEWTADPFRIRSLKKDVKARLRAMQGYRTSKGGSYLCHRSYCYRYRIAARSGNSPDSATTHQGFRLVYDTA